MDLIFFFLLCGDLEVLLPSIPSLSQGRAAAERYQERGQALLGPGRMITEGMPWEMPGCAVAGTIRKRGRRPGRSHEGRIWGVVERKEQ